ncbi:MAG: ATPase, T2SS/T4P/T4SS family [Amphritea sp.]|nr:ATPase, T2SS/T4P/T4SS family [Amphritea sp.]
MQLDLSKLDISADSLIFTTHEDSAPRATGLQMVHNDQSAPAFLNRILLDAIIGRASDIHFEPYEDKYRIRTRVDGVMQEIASMPSGFGQQLTARLKVIAGLDIAEHRGTQSGRFRMKLDADTGLDFRCSVVPTLYGETIVLRLLYLPPEILELDSLGMEPRQIAEAKRASQQLQGMILVTGPTGSGKTVTLYTLLKQLNSLHRNIYTVEDPVEINLPGVNQINISERQGVTFANVARTILRQDPDVIMLGEMRDAETLDTAIKAAHTGHLVLSTLHANTAPKVVPRLRNIGADPYDVASTVSLVISQRLVRKLNPAEAEPCIETRERLLAVGFSEDEIQGLTLYRPKQDASQPYKGRIGIFQVMPVDKSLARMIADGANDHEIEQYAAHQGVTDLRRSALNKLKAGLTDISEVERILGKVESVLPSEPAALPMAEEKAPEEIV